MHHSMTFGHKVVTGSARSNGIIGGELLFLQYVMTSNRKITIRRRPAVA
jgi:hypothetical protein